MEKMEQSQSVSALTAFVRQMGQNGLFLLTVLLGGGALIYFILGLFVLLRR